jgi:hypothetical protein
MERSLTVMCRFLISALLEAEQVKDFFLTYNKPKLSKGYSRFVAIGLSKKEGCMHLA